MKIDFSLLEGAYLRDLLDEPLVLGRTLGGLQESAALSDVVRDLERGVFRRVVLTGMGASFFALHPLFLSLNKAGVTTLLVETSELLHVMPEILDAGTLLVIASQSGQSVEMIRLLDLRKPVRILAVTNHANSELARRADAVVFTQAGEEASVSCKTYVCILLALQWLRGVLCRKNVARVTEDLSAAAPAADQYLANWRAHVQEAYAEMKDVKNLFVVGRGESMASAQTGGLILKESTKFHAEGMSSAGFRHGPFEMVRPGVFVLVFSGEGATAVLNKNLVDDVRKAGGRAALVGPDAESALYRMPGPWSLASPVLEILPVQMISLALAALANREPGKFDLITKVTTVE
jgi:glucosamine--fructose-6-phosphate aminotransferase (isomerizing)